VARLCRDLTSVLPHPVVIAIGHVPIIFELIVTVKAELRHRQPLGLAERRRQVRGRGG
jgi:hypothetical protein